MKKYSYLRRLAAHFGVEKTSEKLKVVNDDFTTGTLIYEQDGNIVYARFEGDKIVRCIETDPEGKFADFINREIAYENRQTMKSIPRLVFA